MPHRHREHRSAASILFKRLSDQPLMFRFGSLGRFGFALGSVCLALGLTLGVEPLHQQPPTLLFFLAVVLTGWYAGIAAGITASLLSIFVLDWFFVKSVSTGQLDWLDVFDFVTFAGVGCLASIVEARWRTAHRSLVEVENEIAVARQIQLKLFPSESPAAPGFDIAGSCIPANATGGDFYDYLPMPSGHLGISLGDVSSHGLGPALVMALIRAYLRALGLTQFDPGTVLSEANQILCDDLEDGRFVTVLLCALHLESRQLTYCGAGHEGYVVEPSGEVITLKSTGLPLGIDSDRPCVAGPAISLQSGQVVLLMSDGIVESANDQRELFGLPRAVETVVQNRTRPAAEIVTAVLEAARAFRQPAPQTDDTTVVVIKVL
ncbi:MAG: SpoIIE family protein phosphatase [Planctomycetes bacterium]|nr:SpoIIE family protein phosphatase [Planctomycetota bacterium]